MNASTHPEGPGIFQRQDSGIDPKKEVAEKSHLNQAKFYLIKDKINENKILSAKNLLKEAITDNIEDPEIYNLFGILYEYIGDIIKASKFYRVAYYMDQTFRPALENLSRVSQFNYSRASLVSWGIIPVEVDRK